MRFQRATTLKGKDKILRMHREIWKRHYGEIPEGMIVDHKDRNPLNNLKSNLRLATTSQNNLNRAKNPKSASFFRGVNQNTKNPNKWEARCSNDGSRYYLGVYLSEEQAAIAHDIFYHHHNPDFVVYNFPGAKVVYDLIVANLRKSGQPFPVALKENMGALCKQSSLCLSSAA